MYVLGVTWCCVIVELAGRARRGSWPTLQRLERIRAACGEMRAMQPATPSASFGDGDDAGGLDGACERVVSVILQLLKAGRWHGDDAVFVELMEATGQPVDVVFAALDVARDRLSENLPGPVLDRLFARPAH